MSDRHPGDVANAHSGQPVVVDCLVDRGKAAWYAAAERAGTVPRAVFWPVPNVDSGLVRLTRRAPPALPDGVARTDVFTVIDQAFALHGF